MGEGEPGGVKEVSVEREGVLFLADDVGGSVEGVADDRMTEGLEVDANLMGAAGLDADFDEGEGAVRGGKAFEDFDMGDGGADSLAVSSAAGVMRLRRTRSRPMGRLMVVLSLAMWPWTRAM